MKTLFIYGGGHVSPLCMGQVVFPKMENDILEKRFWPDGETSTGPANNPKAILLCIDNVATTFFRIPSANNKLFFFDNLDYVFVVCKTIYMATMN